MVSFQCDGCQDVVKKPKLDNHSYKCQASFTCVDCSKTFNAPVEWKGHTSCVSEAEKYQKGLYKGKKSQTGSSGPQGDKYVKATDDVKGKSGAVESGSKNGAEKKLPEDRTVEETVLRLKGNPDSAVADESAKEKIQGKNLKKEEKKKKKKRKTAEIEDIPTSEAVPSKEIKVTKKQEPDAANDKGKVEADDKANTNDVPLPEISLSKKERMKEKKNKKKRNDGADSSQTGAPPQADVRPASASAISRDDAGEFPFLGHDTSNEAPARKKKKKEKSKSKREKVLSSPEETLDTEVVKADKKRKQSEAEGVEETPARETKKAKNERKRKERKGKTEAVEGSEATTS